MNQPPAQCSDDLECVQAVTNLALAASQASESSMAALLSHRATIFAIAAELQRPAAEIAELYCAELNRLCRSASVAEYLPIFTAKKVREQLMPGIGTARAS